MPIDLRQAVVLAYAGTIPFVLCALLPWLGLPVVPRLGSTAEIAAGYSVAIASFMAGVHWGTFLYQSARTPLNLLLTSNAVTVGVWLAFLLMPAALSLMVMLGAFLILLSIDIRLAQMNLLTDEYLSMRRRVTGIVVACLAMTAATFQALGG